MHLCLFYKGEKMKIGIDIGGSHIAIAIVNKEGKIIQKIEQDLVIQEKMSQYILNYVDRAIEKLEKIANIEQIGIAAPGNPNGSTITNLVNLGIEKINFEYIEKKYHVPLKSINDGKAAAMAEKAYGAIREYSDSAFLCLGTGIGGAVFLNNELLKANRNPGFEIGHMVIDRKGEKCRCGKKGCFETYCSMKRLKNKLQRILQTKTKQKIENAVILKEILEKNIEDGEIQNTIEEYIENLMIGLSNIIDIFEPEIICLGGSFVYFKEILYDKLIEKMEKERYVFNKQSLPKIVLASLGNDAGIIGATLIE